MPAIDLAQTFSKLPPAPELPPRRAHAKLIVLDDDPTGTQTVHGIPVLTHWDEDSLASELRDPAPAVFLLTNTRALPAEAAIAVNRRIGEALRAASLATGKDYVVVSRSDSTLRGHFPAETDALAAALGGVDATFLIPAFFHGGRYTLNDIHYVAEGDRLVPAAETEFARDAAFGYQHSNLREWAEEKSDGRIQASEVLSISLEELRGAQLDSLAGRLASMPVGSLVIVNAAAHGDLAVLTHVLADTRLRSRRFLFRTAADFVSSFSALAPRSLLSPDEIRSSASRQGGLLAAGSYVGKTTAQLERLFAAVPDLVRVEIAVPSLLDPAIREAEVVRAREAVECAISCGHSVALHTSRTLITGSDPGASLHIGSQISSALVELVRSLSVRPAWFIAKGGITSSDLATDALQIRRAIVIGQALPGVPVWRTGPESKWPGLAYVIFPGNVGGHEALATLVRSLLSPQYLGP